MIFNLIYVLIFVVGIVASYFFLNKFFSRLSLKLAKGIQAYKAKKSASLTWRDEDQQHDH